MGNAKSRVPSNSSGNDAGEGDAFRVRVGDGHPWIVPDRTALRIAAGRCQDQNAQPNLKTSKSMMYGESSSIIIVVPTNSFSPPLK